MSIRQRLTLHRSALLLLVILLVSGIYECTYAQTNVEKYGQNRLQFRKFKWRYYDTKHFRIYHYDRAGRELARYVAEQVENDIGIIESKIGYQFPERFNIILYNSYDEYKQTNIGRKNDSQLQDIPAGTVNIVGDKLVVYFSGEHTDLRRQTRAGMARVVMERKVFGETLREVVRNAVLMNLPQWTITGFISYVVDGWDFEANSNWKNLMEAYPEAGFYKLAEVEPELAGKAFWKYVSDRYGEGSMKELVYQTQAKSSLNQAVKMMMGMKIKYAYDSAMAFYKEVYAIDEQKQDQPDSTKGILEIEVPKDGSIIRDIRVSPKGHDVAYVTWKNGEWKINLQKTIKTQVSSTVMQGGRLDFSASPDPDYPIITWSNTGYKLAILYKKDQQTKLRIYNAIDARIENYDIPDNRFDRVLGMTFMEDDNKLIMSAIKKSKSDIYEFRLRGKRMTNITEDEWDDLDPWYVSGGSRRGILFLSNRPKPNLNVPLGVNELPTGPMNVYFYNTTTEQTELLQLTDVEDGEISQPIQYGTENYAYLYNKNGINNQYIIMLENDVNSMDSAYSVPVTNYSRNILAHQYSPLSNQVADVVQEGGKYKVYYKKLQLPGQGLEVTVPRPTTLKETEANKKVGSIKDGKLKAGASILDQEDDEPILKKGNAFQSQFENEGKTAKTKKAETKEEVDESEPEEDEITLDENSNETDSTYLLMRSRQYRTYFEPDFLSVKLDNTVLFTRYQPADLNGNQFSNPSLGGMVTVSLDDLMEDYRFTGGVRLPINFSGMTYFFQFENSKRYVDWNLLYLRQNRLNNYVVNYVDTSSPAPVILQNEQLGKNTTDMLQGAVNYPFNKFESIRLTMGFRRDVLNYKSQDILSLTFPAEDREKFWATSRAEYVYDNSVNPVINIYNGFRVKFFGEYMMRLNGPGGGFYNFGTDFRYYKKIYKSFIWTARFAAAHSGGNQKILYFVGGVDNWIAPKYSDNTPIRPGEEYAFQALATNMRGYDQNSWNGNSYGMLNTEFRLPIFTTFLQRPIQSALVRNLQLVTFADVGSAWYGLWPTESNVKNDNIFMANQLTVSIDDTKEVFGLGYGVGLRTMVFGYFLRGDCAWNVDNHRRKPMLIFSMGTDF